MNPNEDPNSPLQNAGAQSNAPFVGSAMPGQQFAPQQTTPKAFAQPMASQQPMASAPFVAGMPTMMNVQPPKRSRKGLVLVLLIVIVVAAVGTYFGLKKPTTTGNGTAANGGTGSSSQFASQLSMLAKDGGKITSGDLDKFDKTALFFAVFKNAAMQNVVHVTSDAYEGSSPTDQSTRAYEFLHDSTFNYKTKQLALVSQSGDYTNECVNGTEYEYSETFDASTGSTGNSWAPSANNTCDMSDYAGYINDGINTGGLSASQAQTYVAGLASASGLISVKSMSLTTHAGAPYVRMVVTVSPIQVEIDGTSGYEGMGVIGGWLKQAGINLTTWPYQSVGTIATGAQLIYYINPATQLPAYSQISLTYSRDDNTGKQVPNQIYDFQDTQYAFGGSVTAPSTTAAPQTIKLSWPEEKP
ncbi:MAG TPA: hypothetical protein VIM53_00555 [Candidatus Saccharimonadales bacterium]